MLAAGALLGAGTLGLMGMLGGAALCMPMELSLAELQPLAAHDQARLSRTQRMRTLVRRMVPRRDDVCMDLRRNPARAAQGVMDA